MEHDWGMSFLRGFTEQVLTIASQDTSIIVVVGIKRELAPILPCEVVTLDFFNDVSTICQGIFNGLCDKGFDRPELLYSGYLAGIEAANFFFDENSSIPKDSDFRIAFDTVLYNQSPLCLVYNSSIQAFSGIATVYS